MSNSGPLIPLANTATLLGTVLLNYLVNAKVVADKTVGEVSKKYNSYFTPADYAFSIWGFIYLALFVFIGYQWYCWVKYRQGQELTGIWLVLANISNGAWVYFWVQGYTGLSVVVMLVLLFSLIMLVGKLNMERWDAPLRTIAFVWWPVSFYLGWIVLATVANISAYLVSVGYHGAPFTPQVWTIIMITISTIVYLFLIFLRNMREASLIGVWGLVAIAYKHWSVNNGIVFAALTGCAILLLACVYHGYKNRETSPVKKWKRGEL